MFSGEIKRFEGLPHRQSFFLAFTDDEGVPRNVWSHHWTLTTVPVLSLIKTVSSCVVQIVCVITNQGSSNPNCLKSYLPLNSALALRWTAGSICSNVPILFSILWQSSKAQFHHYLSDDWNTKWWGTPFFFSGGGGSIPWLQLLQPFLHVDCGDKKFP